MPILYFVASLPPHPKKGDKIEWAEEEEDVGFRGATDGERGRRRRKEEKIGHQFRRRRLCCVNGKVAIFFLPKLLG